MGRRGAAHDRHRPVQLRAFSFGRCRKTRRELTDAEANEHAALTKRVDELDHKLHELYDAEAGDADAGALSALEAQAERVREALEQFEAERSEYSAQALAIAGAVLCVGRNGCIES